LEKTLNIFEKIRRLTEYAKAQGRKVEEILVDSTWVVRGGIFLVEYETKFYIVMNKGDLMYAIAGLPAIEQATLQEHIFGISVWEDSYKTLRVMCGVFHVTFDYNTLPKRNDSVSRPA
jgi:hypothetical protein